jgi:hypothetical protein
MAKAFDTISHDFLSECYSFFNLGPKFINMLETVGKNRQACIILENGKFTPNFKLDSGRPQGEILSPIQYNLCNQILLIKIELDPRIKSIFTDVFGPRAPFSIVCNNLPENKFFACESERETDNAEGFADDSTALTVADQQSISGIEEILIDFEQISGLVCNFSKSSIMFFGNIEGSENIKTKFSRSDSISLLGMNIDCKAENLQKNFDKAKINMQKIINFWSRFNLSITGRIKIAKCFLLSQVNYLGCIVLPNEDDINWMQNAMDSFCTGTLRVSRDKIYTPVINGGMGLINIKESLMAQHCTWFKRANKSTRDNWRYDLWVAGSGNCLNPDPGNLCPLRNPILYPLTISFRKFTGKFYTTENNFLESFIMNNPCIVTELGFPYEIRTNFWLQNGNTDILKLCKLKIKDFLTAELKMKPFADLNRELSINLSFTTYIRLSGIIKRASSLFLKPEKPAKSLENFFAGFKKGSKTIRKVMGQSNNKLPEVVTAFCTVTNQTNISEKIFAENLGFFEINSIPNNLREFIFKFFHNRLGLNTRIAHFLDS